MFTGIINDIGIILNLEDNGDTRINIKTRFETDDIMIGASIACAGICLTVIEKGNDWFAVEASKETLDCTTAKFWQIGQKINLERALRVGDELGGHWVSGHVDGLAQLISIKPEGNSHRLCIAVPPALAGFIAPKGSIALDGVSLTVNEVIDTPEHQFGVNIIPHTWALTTLGALQAGQYLNLEIDLMARYVARQLQFGRMNGSMKS